MFDLKITFCEGGVSGGCIDKFNALNGEIMKINTLFPSPPCEDGDCNDMKVVLH